MRILVCGADVYYYSSHDVRVVYDETSMDSELMNWLQSTNLQMSKEELSYSSRPLEAISRLSKERKMSGIIPSLFADEIFKWFEDHSPANAHAVGAMFTGAFYYDSFFWKLEIPLGYGTVQSNALDALSQMPPPVKEQLQRDHSMMWKYILLWVDSVDYGFGISDLDYGIRLPSIGNQGFAAQLTASAHRELTASVRLLTESRSPNAKALETGRMATEMFLKAYLAMHASLTEEDAQKKFGHNLVKLVSDCKSARGQIELDDLAQYMKVFPPIGSRYEGLEYENQQLWSAYAVTLRTGVTFTRSLTDRDIRGQIQRS